MGTEETNAISLMASTTADILDRVIESPELSPEFLTEISKVNLTGPQRVDAAAFLLEKIKDEQAFYKKQAEKFTKVARALDKIHEAIKDGVKINMFERGENDLLGETMRFKMIEIDPRLEYDETKLPPDYFRQVVETKVDDSKLRADLAKGVVIEGASLIANFRLTPYVNRKIKAATGA
jgi:hypothetical protein